MAADKRLPVVLDGDGLALRNTSKSLKITNKLLTDVDYFEGYWEWWLELSEEWKNLFFFEDGIAPKYYEWNESDYVHKLFMEPYLYKILALSTLDLRGGYATHDYTPITDIAPLKIFTNLTSLDLGENDINNISYLAELKNLRKVILYCNSIYDISPLENLINLTILDLRWNNIISISVLF